VEFCPVRDASVSRAGLFLKEVIAVAANKPSSREQVKQIVARIEQGIQDLFQSEKYADYLRTMSRFHSYSFSNTILIQRTLTFST